MKIGRMGVLLTVIAAIVVGGIAGCGSSDGGGGEATAALPPSPEGKADAANFDGVHSGEVELVLAINRTREKTEFLKARVLGTFLEAGEAPLPQVDLAIESRGELAGHAIEFRSGPLLRADKWIVNFDGKVYEPDHASYEELKSKFEEAQQEEGGAGNALACVEAAAGFNLSDFVHHVSVEGKGEAVDGTKVVNLEGSLDLPEAIAEVVHLTEGSPGCKAQLEAVGLPPAAELKMLAKQLGTSTKSAQVTLSIDKNGVVRYFKVLADVELEHGEKLEVETYMRLTRVNEVTEVANTHGYSPYPALLRQFGLNPEDVQQADAGEIYAGVLEALANRLFGRSEA